MTGVNGPSRAEGYAEVVRRELLLRDPGVRADPGRVRQLLHPEFVEFGASGRIWDAENVVEALEPDPVPHGLREAVDLVPSSLSPDTVLLTYRIDSQESPSLRSSVWLRNAEGEWLLRFHQGTPTARRP